MEEEWFFYLKEDETRIRGFINFMSEVYKQRKQRREENNEGREGGK